LQLRAIQATDSRQEYLFRDYFGLRLVMLVGALIVITGLIVVSSYGLELALTVFVIGFGKAVDAVSDVIYGLIQQREEMDRISISHSERHTLLYSASTGAIFNPQHSMGIDWLDAGICRCCHLLRYTQRQGNPEEICNC